MLWADCVFLLCRSDPQLQSVFIFKGCVEDITHTQIYTFIMSSSSPVVTSETTAAAPTLHADRCLKLVEAVRGWDYMSMFHMPVTDAEVPGYSDIISDPMDLHTIDTRLKSTTEPYTCDTDVVSDLELMVANALKFNDPEGAWYAHAKALKKKLPPLISEMGLEIDEEELAYVGEGSAKEGKDSMRGILKDEKKEVVREVLKGMQDDMKVTDEDLLKMYGDPKKRAEGAAVIGKKRAREEDGSGSSGSESGSDDSDDDSDSSDMSTDGSSGSSSSSSDSSA